MNVHRPPSCWWDKGGPVGVRIDNPVSDTALRGDQLDEAAALQAQQEAEEALQGMSGETDLARAQLELAEARARYQAAQKLKGKR